jgi:hypothetical protein
MNEKRRPRTIKPIGRRFNNTTIPSIAARRIMVNLSRKEAKQ